VNVPRKRVTDAVSLVAGVVGALSLASSAPAFAAGHVRVVAQAVAPPKPLTESLSPAARVEYESGKILFLDGDAAGALVKFQRAYELSKDPRLLWNVAVCEKRLRHYARVIEHLERYRIEGASVLEPDELRDAAELIAELRPFTGTVRLKVNQSMAEVTVDGQPVGSTPLDRAIVLDIGQRTIRVTREGYLPVTRQVMISGPEEQAIEVQLVPELHEGRLLVVTDPSATIYIDDEVVGVERWDGKLASGMHTVRVRALDGTTERREVMVKDGDARVVQIGVGGKDGPVPKGGGGIGTAGWVGIVGGSVALIAGGVVTGMVLGNRTKDPVQGTMNPGVVQLP